MYIELCIFPLTSLCHLPQIHASLRASKHLKTLSLLNSTLSKGKSVIPARHACSRAFEMCKIYLQIFSSKSSNNLLLLVCQLPVAKTYSGFSKTYQAFPPVFSQYILRINRSPVKHNVLNAILTYVRLMSSCQRVLLLLRCC